MRMVHQGLTPRVQHGDEADLGAEALGVGGDLEQRLRGGAEQDVVDRLLVLQGDRGELGGAGEDDVEVGDWEQVSASVFDPFEAT